MLLMSWYTPRTMSERIERDLVTETRLAAELLARQSLSSTTELDAEADVLGKLGSARVTFIAHDGRVVGDSDVPLSGLAALENHGDRPEVRDAHSTGLGIARRYSSTVGADMLYVAVPIRESGSPSLSVVRYALPMTDLDNQLTAVWRVVPPALLAGVALGLALAWITANLLATRIRSIGAIAERHAAGDRRQISYDYGQDEIGVVARALESSFRELDERASGYAEDR